MHILKQVQDFPVKKKILWDFISRPENLSKITPPSLGFEILSPKDEIEKMYEGLLIAYKVRPFGIVPVYWLTEITVLKEGEYFIDEQRKGPYAFWHHRHILIDLKRGVRMLDLVYYEMPYGILGEGVHSVLVRPRLEYIFTYRRRVLEELFGKI